MKLTIGDKYHNEQEQYVEEVEIIGLESIDENIPKGEVVVPKDGDSVIEVRCINNITGDFFPTRLTLRDLHNRFEQGEANFS